MIPFEVLNFLFVVDSMKAALELVDLQQTRALHARNASNDEEGNTLGTISKAEQRR